MKNRYTGFWTLFKKEFLRFFKVPNNTIFPFLITVFFYFIIFGIAIGSRIKEVAGVSYLVFILPGLFVQLLINGSYSNPSGSLFVSRNWGSIEDLLVAPISYTQFSIAYILAGMLRGIFLGIGTIIIASFFTPLQFHNILLLLVYVLLISFLFACIGIIIGLWAKNHEQLNIFINFIVTPLTFLGGVFYTLDMVPETVAKITLLNPLFYMINGVRYGFIGITETPITLGIIILVIICVLTYYAVFTMIRKGYNLRT